ncbi:HNH endonuclease [uncultured Bacteroides sp.]|nr:HNH endonuclease [uncultured Bacteroides sp.]
MHHIQSFMNYEGLKRREMAFNYNNLQSICKECHQKEHNH